MDSAGAPRRGAARGALRFYMYVCMYIQDVSGGIVSILGHLWL